MRGALAASIQTTEEEERAPAGGGRVAPERPRAVHPERALLERYRDGDAGAFGAIVGAWQAPVYGYLARSGVAGAERDDLFQEVFLRVHRALRAEPAAEEDAGTSESAPSGPVGPWIFAIAVNAVRSHFRKAKVRGVVALREDVGESAADGAPGPERAVAIRETAAWLDGQIAKLPLEQREALLLCAVEGMELRDAAEALGVPIDTVKTRLRRARLALAEARARRATREEREGGR